jgi:hypothetical protein
MESRSSLRSKFGAGYFTVISDTQLVHWKPLSLEDFFYYEDLSKNPEIVSSVIEDEIFKKCVVDNEFIKHVDELAFGTISIVVQNIMEHSGPLSINHFNDFLDSKRLLAQEPIHHLVTLVVRAFPAYKPEDVYAMPFDTFMLRLAQAESLLTLLGIVTEPIKLISEQEEAAKPKKQRPVPAELRAAWDKQQENLNKPKAPVKPPQPTKDKHGVTFAPVDMSAEKSPLFNKNKKHPDYKELGDLNVERITTEQSVGSEEESAERAKMIKEAQKMHAALINKLEFYKPKK